MIQGLLLAAGNSSRFGGQKLLAPLGEGRSVAMAAAMPLLNAVDRVTAVVKPEDKTLADLYKQQNIRVVCSSISRGGMGNSIAFGVSESKDAHGWVIALADMPFVNTTTIKAVASAIKNGALIAVPVCQGRRGHPVGFSQKLYSELIQLTGDKGARVLLTKYPSEVLEIPCQDRGILIDIDTTEDLEAYSRDFL